MAGAGALGVRLSATLDGPADVVIDFSGPAGTLAIVESWRRAEGAAGRGDHGARGGPASRGHSGGDEIPLLWSPSMSMAVNLAMKLSGIAAARPKGPAQGADIEIIERHHRFKEDAPSGTALKFGEIIAGGWGKACSSTVAKGGPATRPHNEIGYHAVRTGDNPGEHTIIFGLLGETMEITVRATNRDCYAHGAWRRQNSWPASPTACTASATCWDCEAFVATHARRERSWNVECLNANVDRNPNVE